MDDKRILLVLVLATTLAYLPVLVADPVEFVFDDIRFVEDNVAVHDLSNALRYFTDPRTIDPQHWGGIYRPLRTLDFAIDWSISSAWDLPGKVRWFHFRNLGYHVLAVLLAFTLFRRWGASALASALAALIFALHPVQVEAVAWVTSRADLMFLVLFLLALLFHGRSRGLDLRFFGTAACLVLALLSKESAVVFVGAAVLTDFFFRDDRRLAVTLSRWPKYATYAGLAVAFFLAWKGIHDSLGEPWWHLPVRWGESFWGTLLTMSRGFVYYSRLIFFPVDMAQDWYLTQVKSPDFLTLACMVAVAGVLLLSIVGAFRRGGVAAFGVLWFFLAILPASNLPAPIGIPTAERFLYLPMVGVALAGGTLLARVCSSGRPARILVVLFLLCLGAVSAERTLTWTTNKSLWLTTLERVDSPRAWDWRGKRDLIRGEEALRRRRRLVDEDKILEANAMADRAQEFFEESLRSYDRVIEIWSWLPNQGPVALARTRRSRVLSNLDRPEQGLEEANRALSVWPEHPAALAARAIALYGLGRFREAALDIENSLEALELPENRTRAAAIYEKLAMTYNRAGNRAQTYLALQRAWKHLPDEDLNPDVFRARNELEAEFRALAGPPSAAIDKNPEDYIAALDLASVYANYGYYDQAGRLFHALLGSERPETGQPAVLFPYARFYWQTRDTEEGYREAARLYRIILEIQPDHELARSELPHVEAELMRFRSTADPR